MPAVVAGLVVLMSDDASHALEVHILRLVDEVAVVVGWLHRQVKRKTAVAVRVSTLVGSVASALDGEFHWSQVLNGEGVSACLCIPCLAWGVGLGCYTLLERIGRLACSTTNDELVGDEGCGVRTEVVEIHIDVVGIFVDDTIAEFSIHQSETFASVVEERNLRRRRRCLAEVGEWIVGDEFVVVTCHEEVTSTDFWIELVELCHLACLRWPCGGVGCALHLCWNGLGKTVIEVDDNRDGLVTPRLLEVGEVVHELSIASVEMVGLLVESIVEVARSGVLVGIVARVVVVDKYHLVAANHFLTGRDVDASVNHLSEEVEPSVVEGAECTPVAALVAVHVGMVELSEVLCPNEFGTVPHSSTVDSRLFEYRAITAGSRIFLSVSFAKKCFECAVPSAVVVAHTIVRSQSRDERSERHTLIIIEA